MPGPKVQSPVPPVQKEGRIPERSDQKPVPGMSKVNPNAPVKITIEPEDVKKDVKENAKGKVEEPQGARERKTRKKKPQEKKTDDQGSSQSDSQSNPLAEGPHGPTPGSEVASPSESEPVVIQDEPRSKTFYVVISLLGLGVLGAMGVIFFKVYR